MITGKQIEKAAEKYGTDNDCLVIGRDGRMSLKPELENAFEEGAHWAIEQFLKGLWHDAEEEPRNSTFLVEYPYHGKLEYSVDCTENMKRVFCDWETYIKHTEITRWLYIDDLLPKQKGGSDD